MLPDPPQPRKQAGAGEWVVFRPEELELPPRLSDPQAERLWRHLAGELREGSSLAFETPERAVAYLAGKRGARPGAAADRPHPGDDLLRPDADRSRGALPARHRRARRRSARRPLPGDARPATGHRETSPSPGPRHPQAPRERHLGGTGGPGPAPGLRARTRADYTRTNRDARGGATVLRKLCGERTGSSFRAAATTMACVAHGAIRGVNRWPHRPPSG
jgi:hypothetical protein